MSKTLTSILAVAAAVAIVAVPGIGAAISSAVFSGLSGIGVGLGTAATISIASTYVLTTGLTLFGIQQGASLLGLGPSIPKPETTETAIKTSRPPRVSAYGRSRLYGAYVLYETATNGTAVDIYAVHDGKIDAIEAHYLADEEVTLTGNTVDEGDDGRYRDGAVKLYTTDGSDPGTAFSAITSLLSSIWTSDHRGDGVVMMALTAASVKAKLFQETYPQSTVPIPSLVARWQPCPDPANVDPSNEAAWTWTENPVRHLLHYKLKREGADYATKIAPAIDSWIEAAADCDDPTALKAGGTEARYRSTLVHKHTDAHKDVTSTFLATFDGWIAPRADGALVVYSGRYVEPTVSIGSAEIVAYTWEGAGIDDDKAVNEIICSYVSAEHDYNTVECDAWRDEDDISARGQLLSQPLEAQVPSHGQARRLAKRKIARIMAPHRGTVTTNVAGRSVRGQRYINLHIEEAGAVFYSGPAEITGLTRNISTGGVTFSWVSADPDIDDWNPATEEGEPAAKGDRIAPAPLTAPVITAVQVIAGPRLQLTVTSPDREDLTWFGRTRVQGATEWGTDLEYNEIAGGTSVTLVTDIVPNAETIEVQVAYQVGDGRLSAWSASATADAVDVGEAPNVLSVGATASGVGAITPALPADYEIGQPLLLVVETANEAVATPAGWAIVTGSPQGAGTGAAADAVGLSVFWKRAVDGETAPNIADPGDHVAARIYALERASRRVNPFNTTAGTTALSGTAVSMPGVTTTVSNCLIINLVAWSTDSSSEQLSSPANPALSGVALVGGPRTTQGNGGGVSLVVGIKAGAGATGSTTGTLAAASRQALLTIAVAPEGA